MNSTLEQSLHQADGRYFNDVELKTLEQFVQTYSIRAKTYALLCERSDDLILQALRRLAATDGTVVQQHGEKCKRDMSYVVRTLALTILKDDAAGFREQLVLWMQNIMSALHKEAQSARAYRLLQDVVREKMPAEAAQLINRYLEEFITALMVGAE
ncbi:MAG TPA: hypothetical protein IGS37_11280 [Synechococcales cyanobacterium M55_K2018_004]|nr:hypothetical protein [Synechococcales cyanobacterium M55_K2018_004]